MEGPLDFIGQDYNGLRGNMPLGLGNPPSSWAPNLSSIFANPFVIGADLAANFLVVNPALNMGKLAKMMSPGQVDNLRALVSSHGFEYNEHGVRASLMKMSAKDIGAKAPGFKKWGSATYARDMAMREAMVERFGARAASRISFARAASGLSRFMFAYTMVDLGLGIARSVVDAITNYERPSRPARSRQLETGGLSFDTRAAQTQRMRSIQAIHNTQLSTRAAMGNEAAMLHLA
jgi:hypothetical protein